jgi:hypothetical protein
MLEFVDEKKCEIDAKKVARVTKAIEHDSFNVLRKVVDMDTAVYNDMHVTFGKRANSGRKKVEIPTIDFILDIWRGAIKSCVAV